MLQVEQGAKTWCSTRRVCDLQRIISFTFSPRANQYSLFSSLPLDRHNPDKYKPLFTYDKANLAEAGINPDYPTVYFAHGYLAGPESVESKTIRKGAFVLDDCVTLSHALITSIAKRRLRAFSQFRKVLINTVCSFAAYAARGGYNYINVGWKALAGKNSHSRERFAEVMSVL